MTGEVDAMEFLLAEALGKTLTEIRSLPERELQEWRGFYEWRHAMAAMERERHA